MAEVSGSSPLPPTTCGARRLMYPAVTNLCSKLGEGGNDPAYIFAEPRVGYRMAKGGTQGLRDIYLTAERPRRS